MQVAKLVGDGGRDGDGRSHVLGDQCIGCFGRAADGHPVAVPLVKDLGDTVLVGKCAGEGEDLVFLWRAGKGQVAVSGSFTLATSVVAAEVTLWGAF